MFANSKQTVFFFKEKAPIAVRYERDQFIGEKKNFPVRRSLSHFDRQTSSLYLDLLSAFL